MASQKARRPGAWIALAGLLAGGQTSAALSISCSSWAAREYYPAAFGLFRDLPAASRTAREDRSKTKQLHYRAREAQPRDSVDLLERKRSAPFRELA